MIPRSPWSRIAAPLAWSCLAALVACSEPAANPGAALPAGMLCAPGGTQLCLCAPGVQGVQVCRDDGLGWQACACAAADAASSDAAAGAGADGAADDSAVASADDAQPTTDAAPIDAAADALEPADVPDAPDAQGTADIPGTADTQDAGDALAATDWGSYFDDVPEEDAGAGGDPDTAIGPGYDCIARAKLVYVVSAEKVLLSFDPATLKLEVVGQLACPAPPGHTPFSMAVDHDATAWVLYQPGFGGAGSLFQVSTLDASCQATTFQPGQQGFELFGMAFSATGPGSPDEVLYVSGGKASQFSDGIGKLGKIAFPSLQLTAIGQLSSGPGSPDLTGNGLGQLFGFFPSTLPPSVRQIDTGTAGTGKIYNLPPQAFAGVQAWAFAWWGGDFYLFFKSYSDTSSAIWKLDGKTGVAMQVVPKTGYTLVGAGVSSCAPSQKPTAP